MWTWLKRRAWPALKAIGPGWSRHDGALLSAAMAYYAAFSLFPLVLLLISGVGLLLRISANAQFQEEQLNDLIAKNISPWLAEQLDRLMVGIRGQAGVGGPVGLVMLIIGAIAVFVQFSTMIDRVWERTDASHGFLAALRAVLLERLVAFVMFTAVGVLLLVLLIADVALAGLQSYLIGIQGGYFIWQAGHVLGSTAAYTLLLGLIYKVLPPRPVPWRAALSGGLLVAIIWKAGQEILTTFVIGEHYSAYGVVGSFIAVMLWIYYASAVVFAGAEFVHGLCQTYATDAAAPEPRDG